MVGPAPFEPEAGSEPVLWVDDPAGARIVGRSQVVNYMGASRLFIRFERLILPNGVAAAFPGGKRALSALDATGALGVATDVNRHWLLQFGTAIFVGVLEGLGAAAQQHTTPYSGQAYVIEDTTDNFEKILKGNIEIAVAAIKQGAYDFIEKPLSLDRVILTIDNVVRTRRLQRGIDRQFLALLRETAAID